MTSESSPSPAPLKILIVEDNRDARTTLRMLLSMVYGHVVFESGDGLSAIDLILQERPDVALIDLGLPGLDGCEVARRIRAALGPGAIFLAALTGYGADEDRMRSHEAGFDVHLLKPVDTDVLAQLLAQVAASGASGRG